MNLTRRVLVVLLILAFLMVSLPLNALAQTVKVVPKDGQAAPTPLIWHLDYPFYLALLQKSMGSPPSQRFNTASCQSFSMYFAWNPYYGGPVHVSLIYEGSLVILYANTFYGGYGSFTVNYFPYTGFVRIFVSNLDNLYYLDIEGTTSLWYQ